MEKKKMYSYEILDKATSAVAKGFSCGDHIFKESVKELPEEVQAALMLLQVINRSYIQLPKVVKIEVAIIVL